MSKVNIYRVFLQTTNRSDLVKLIEIEDGHTAEKMMEAVLPHVQDLMKDVMKRFREMMTEKYSHIIALPCCDQVVNLVALRTK